MVCFQSKEIINKRRCCPAACLADFSLTRPDTTLKSTKNGMNLKQLQVFGSCLGILTEFAGIS